MLKSYEELRQIDVAKYCKDRDGFKYLNWAKCIELLHENGAEVVYFEPVANSETGSSLIMTDIVFGEKDKANRCYETKIKVVIDDKTYYMQTPVLNGKNPVRDSYLNQQLVWNSMCRAFVKCVAIRTGLGFSMWIKEETEEEKPTFEQAPEIGGLATAADIKCIKHYGEVFHLDLDKWIKDNGATWETLTGMQAAQMHRTLLRNFGELEYGDSGKT